MKAKLGELAVESYLARKDYNKTHKDRADARREHPCDEKGSNEIPCWDTGFPLEDWCENCQYVQKYYLAMHKALKRSNVAKQKLNGAIRRVLHPCPNEEKSD